MDKIITNEWRRDGREFVEHARILSATYHPEGLDLERLRFVDAGRLEIVAGRGHLLSVIAGGGTLSVDGEPLRVRAGVHVYLPPQMCAVLDAVAGTQLVTVSATPPQARGARLLVRDEQFLAACACEEQPLRWILTPQYLSRRIFLHHDQALCSRAGHPVSWFHTTMFDVTGLPRNEDGEPVFKMSYNSRTEVNVCYEVAGRARVRMAHHPYRSSDQRWDRWLPLDGESSYHLNEAAGGPEEEWRLDEATRTRACFRNKHEVSIVDGHVSLFCLFDPAPTGVERHRPGEYSDYQPLDEIIGTASYERHRREIAAYDEMVERLSLARARDELHLHEATPLWQLYRRGRAAQAAIEAELARTLRAEGAGRERVIARWMLPPDELG